MAPSFSGPLHQPGAGIPAGTDEMLLVLHLLSHGASWRTFDFLGFNVRRYRRKLLIKPSHAAIRRIRRRLRDELRSLHGSNASAVLKRLNPIIRGWAAYYRTQVSGVAFGKLDTYLWRLTWKWAKRSHSTKPAYWVFARYFGTFNKARQDRWVFGDRTSGSYLHRFAWTNIVRHQIVKHRASLDDPELADYWAWRRYKAPLPINRSAMRLYRAQDGRCAICKATLLAASDRPQTPRDWEHWLATTRKTIDVVWDTAKPDAAAPPRPPQLQPPPPATRACLSRMHGNGHVRCARDMTSSSGVRVPCGG